MQLTCQIPSHQSAHTLPVLRFRHCPVHSKSSPHADSLPRLYRLHAHVRRFLLLILSYVFSCHLLCATTCFQIQSSIRTLPSTTDTLPFAIRSIAFGIMIHSACSITRRCKISGVSSCSTSTAFCKMIGPVSVPSSTK